VKSCAKNLAGQHGKGNCDDASRQQNKEGEKMKSKPFINYVVEDGKFKDDVFVKFRLPMFRQASSKSLCKQW